MAKSNAHISIVVPVFNAQDTLRLLYEQIKTAMDADSRAFELILVNDGSSDSSWAQITKLSAE